jgi:hypothetical protein
MSLHLYTFDREKYGTPTEAEANNALFGTNSDVTALSSTSGFWDTLEICQASQALTKPHFDQCFIVGWGDRFIEIDALASYLQLVQKETSNELDEMEDILKRYFTNIRAWHGMACNLEIPILALYGDGEKYEMRRIADIAERADTVQYSHLSNEDIIKQLNHAGIWQDNETVNRRCLELRLYWYASHMILIG